MTKDDCGAQPALEGSTLMDGVVAVPTSTQVDHSSQMDDEDKVLAVVTTDDGVRYADSEDLEVICR